MNKLDNNDNLFVQIRRLIVFDVFLCFLLGLDCLQLTNNEVFPGLC